MGTELALSTQISNPARLPSLPAPLQRLSDALGSAVQADRDGMHRQVAVLPPGMILNSSDREMVEHHITGLQRSLSVEQAFEFRGKVLGNDAAVGALIAALLIKGAGAKLDTASSDALTEDYLDALEDLPAWSIREAIRKWNRGESPRPLDPKKSHDYHWRPDSATLRWLAQCETAPVKNRIRQLEHLLAAVPLIEFSDEHCAEMRDRLAKIIPDAMARRVPDAPVVDQQHSEAAE